MKQEHNLLIVSDLHLNEGFDPETGKTSRLEDFLRDEAFARFLRYHEQIRSQPRFQGRPWKLILNGDIFDFLQVVSLPEDGMPLRTVKGLHNRSDLSANERMYGLGTTAVESEWKLKQIAQGHQRFFAALGWFVARGNQVAVVRGNHDVELHWPRVQERFIAEAKRAHARQWLREGGDAPKALDIYRERIRFYPWFYYESERIYVEHGGQYDAANHFHDFLNPVLPDDPDRVELPWGSLFVRYLFNKVEDAHPFADNVKPLTRYLSWAFRKDPIKTLEVLIGRGWIFLKALWMMSRKATASALHTSQGDRRSHDKQQLPLPPEITAQIQALAGQRIASSWQMWIGSLFQTLISLLTLLIIGAFIGMVAVTLFLTQDPLWVAGIYAAAAILGALLRCGLRRSISRFLEHNVLMEVAFHLERILEPAHSVRIIAMGHDHQPTIERLDNAWYVNTGAWVPLYQKQGPIEGREVLSFLRLAWGREASPELLRWDDAGGAPARMVVWDHAAGR